MHELCTDLLPSDSPRVTRQQPLLPGWPAGWFMFCPSRSLDRGPVGKLALGQRLVAFRTARGQAAVLGARCAHLGADLAGGCVVGETLRCPFHHWQFDTHGNCVAMPAAGEVASNVGQAALPAVERMGGVYCFNGRRAAYPLPFYDDLTPDHLYASPPFRLVLECPWYMVGANGVDVQHFATTHDRQLLAPPAVSHPRPEVHHVVTRFEIMGRHLRDRLTRLAGREVQLEVHDWSGTLFLVRATFRRTETFGVVSVLPRTPRETEVHVVVAVHRSSAALGRRLFDPVNVMIRRWFIQKFLQPDVARSAGTDCATGRLVAADRLMADYFRWLHSLHGLPS